MHRFDTLAHAQAVVDTNEECGQSIYSQSRLKSVATFIDALVWHAARPNQAFSCPARVWQGCESPLGPLVWQPVWQEDMQGNKVFPYINTAAVQHCSSATTHPHLWLGGRHCP